MAQPQVYSNKLAFWHTLIYIDDNARTTATPDVILIARTTATTAAFVLRGPPRRFRLRVQAIRGQPRYGSIRVSARGQPQPMPITANFRGPPRYFKP